jgi:hypothetical protein
MPSRVKFLAALIACSALIQPNGLWADQVGVHYAEGPLHGFLVLQTLEGKTLAAGDLIQNAAGDRVTTKLVLRFKDGSVHEETTEFSQRDKFQVVKYHVVQKGPAFRRPLETSVDFSSGQVTIRYTDDDGKQKEISERMELPPDIANGIVPTLLKNIQPTTSPVTVSMVAATPKLRLVKLAITSRGEEPFSVGGFKRKATHYVVKVEIGGAAGIVAPLVGKQPPDVHIWILGGEAPVFLKEEGPLYGGGPIWRIEQVSPVWPRSSTEDAPKSPLRNP